MLRVLVGIALLAAPAAAHEYRTVSWYASHPDVARQVMKVCADNAGLAHKNPNCFNAEQSLGDSDYQDFIKRGTRIFGAN
jgi:hypothetical protein